MRALAEYGADEGWRLTGSDASPSPRAIEGLARIGVEVCTPHSDVNVPAQADAIVFSPAVPERNVERLLAASKGITQFSYPQVLGEISHRDRTIAVSGTHGKSTTTGLIASILSAAGRDRAVFCGAEILHRRRHGWAGPGDWSVIEACEYRRHFLELSPAIAVLLGIERDHFDCFSSLEDAVEAYSAFLGRLNENGVTVVNADCPMSLRAFERAGRRRVERISVRPHSTDWWTERIEQQGDLLKLQVVFRGQADCRIETRLLGRHHAVNVLAAVVACRSAGISSEVVESGIAPFSGLHRRLERLPACNGVLRYDDYAHHPTAVRAVLSALREVHPGVRILCVFQPHQLSRTQGLHAEFASALGLADDVAVLPVYGARESQSVSFVEASRHLAEAVAPPARVQFSPSLDHVRDTVETALRPGDLLVTLGAGDIDQLHYALP